MTANAYDAAGNRTSIKHQGQSVKTFNYTYDQSSRMTGVNRAGADTLANYTYDQVGRRTQLDLDTGGTSNRITYGYEPDSALDALQQLMAGTADDVRWDFDYNRANQVTIRTMDNGQYLYHPAATAITYTANGLNQYTFS